MTHLDRLPIDGVDSPWPGNQAWLKALTRSPLIVADEEAAERLVDSVSSILVDVATGGSRIDDVKDEFSLSARALDAVLRRLGIDNPNPYRDLWGWYEFYREHLPTYASRRGHVAECFEPVRRALVDLFARTTAEPAMGGVTGWPVVDAEISKLRERYKLAKDPRDFNAVGLQCVAVHVALGRAVFDEGDLPIDDEVPSSTDWKRRVEYFLDAAAPGRRMASIRKIVRNVHELAQAMKHHDEPVFVEARISAEATIFLAAALRAIYEHSVLEQLPSAPSGVADADDAIPF